ncbi:MAG: UvrD-helicase domain-containing protein [Defluviitaleaceae bacterium]|nr:UvrD-helicase domain-containing protein [Defluviitaleaceae bacterium]
MKLLENLNKAQKEAVMCTEGALLLLAGAGSGKTRVITHRIAYMIDKGVDPFNILAITFTNKAAREMKERVMDLIGFDAVWVSTFHSLCVRILRREIAKIGYENSFSIYDADDSLRLIKLCIKELNINDKQFPPKYIGHAISEAKNNLIGCDEYMAANASDFRYSKVALCYELYQKKLNMANALDFDDIIFLTVRLFKEVPEALKRYHERFKYIMVDEYQDTNTAQYRLIRLLAFKYGNLCVVGDDDQSIYGWRGANINNILDFEKDFENTTVIRLEQNYRSTQKILNAANAVISNNLGRKIKSLWTENDSGADIYFYKAENDIEEAAFIVNTIQDYMEEGVSLNNIAILYRQNSLSRPIEDALVKNNIPYKIYGGVRFYERREIKDVLSYLKCIYNSYDDVAIRRVINTPKRGIGETTVEKIASYANMYEMSFFEALKEPEVLDALGRGAKKVSEFYELIRSIKEFADDNSVSLLLTEVLDKTGYIKELEAENTDEARGRIENINELINKAVEFEKGSEDISLAAFLEEVSLVADIDSHFEGTQTVSLMTMHSSKGLEFKNVFIAGFEEGTFPSYRSVTSGEGRELEEERRLCYVGITRARENLFLTCANQRLTHGQIIYNSPSRFLKELPAEILKQDTYLGKYTNNTQKPQAKAVTRPLPEYNPRPKPKPAPIPAPKNKALDFGVGDNVRQLKYGIGQVMEIKPAGADYEVTVDFETGRKKFMAHLAKLVKVD